MHFYGLSRDDSGTIDENISFIIQFDSSHDIWKYQEVRQSAHIFAARNSKVSLIAPLCAPGVFAEPVVDRFAILSSRPSIANNHRAVTQATEIN